MLVDCDDGYGDAKNVTHTIHTYDEIGASAIFIEDQRSPKKCGHMGGKEVVPAKDMVGKIKAAVEARNDNNLLFILARTDALEPEGLDEVLRRGEQYMKAGADGFYVDGIRNTREMQIIGREFKGIPLATSILEGGGKTPWVRPQHMAELGFSMILYPTTILFQITRAMQRALHNLKAGRPMSKVDGVGMFEFEKIVDIAYWKSVEQQALPLSERMHQAINKIFKKVA